MKASALSALLAPFAKLSNKNALSRLYQAMRIDASTVSACSPWGVLEARGEIGSSLALSDEWLDTSRFLAIARSLPDHEVELESKNNGIVWTCGEADGKLATLPDLKMPDVDWSPLDKKRGLYEPPKTFVDAIELGSVASGPMSMKSAGVYGICFDNRGEKLIVCSSDNVTMASCEADDSNPLFPETLVLNPDAAALLCAILSVKAETRPLLALTDKALYASAGNYRLLLHPASPFKHDLLKLMGNYTSRDAIATIPRDRAVAFVRRAIALTEAKQHANVILRAANGALALSFAEDTATADEYYLMDGLELPGELPTIAVDAQRFARVLSHTDKIALDNVGPPHNVLTFFSEDPAFQYMISGKAT